MDKAATGRAVWAALGTIYLGGIVLYSLGTRPRSLIAREVIPANEPTLVDWAEIGAILFFT